MSSEKVDDPQGTTPLSTIVRTHRSAQVRMQIEDAISRGDFMPGDRLPSERVLVETFGVSRVSVREAIRSLEAIGVIKVQQGRGAFVSDRRSGLGKLLTRWLLKHRDEIFDLHRVRGALDELAAQCAAGEHDASAIEKLETANAALSRGVEEEAPVEELMALDLDFHLAIAEASRNRLLYDLLFDLHTLLAEARRFSFGTWGRPPRSVDEHREIIEAISSADPAAARAAMHNHVASIRSVMSSFLAEDPDEEVAAP